MRGFYHIYPQFSAKGLNKIQHILSQVVVSVVMDSVMILIVAPVLYATNHTLFIIVLFTLPFSSAILFLFSKLYKKQYNKLMAQASDLQSYLVESVNGAATIKAMCAEKTTLHNFEKYQMRTVNTSWAANKLQVFQEMFSELIKQLSNIILFWVGSYLVIKGNMSIGTLISFTALAGYFINPIERIINLQSELQSAFVAARRLGEILELNTEQSKEEKYLCPQKLYGNIEFRNVAFNYGTREQVYRDLSFIINQGEKVAFVGTSGCGKTTIVKLLLKLYQANKGSILLDGNDIKDIDSGTLRMHIGYVPQDIYLFSGTIAENIALHSPCVTLEDITLAAKKAGAADFIERLPNRYATQIGERGLSLSGGER